MCKKVDYYADISHAADSAKKQTVTLLFIYMEIKFTHEAPERKRYLISVDDIVSYTAEYDRKAGIRILLNLENILQAQGYYEYEFNGKLLWVPLRAITVYLTPENPRKIFLKHKYFPDSVTAFIFEGDQYEAFFHFGNKVSIFKNKIQIAYYEVSKYTTGDWDMILIADYDIIKPLIIMFCLSLYSYLFGENEAQSMFNLSFWSREFDETWKPKTI